MSKHYKKIIINEIHKDIRAEDLHAGYTYDNTHPVVIVFRQTDKKCSCGYRIQRVLITREALQKILDPKEMGNLLGVLEQSKHMCYEADVKRWMLALGKRWDPPRRSKKKIDSGCYCVECLSEEEENFYKKHHGLCRDCAYIKSVLPLKLWDDYCSYYQERY